MIILGNYSMKDFFESCGGKAKGLYLLNEVGADIPETLIVPANLDISLYYKQIKTFSDFLESKYQDVKFAVRSSALTEDGVECSWAGMYDTMLNIAPDNLYNTIVDMYHYSASIRQKAYRDFSNANDLSNNMALVVQRMIIPDVSGVCFTVNPISGNTNEIVIEAVNGLGEKLVGGEITPQLFLLDSDGKCKHFDCGDYANVQIIANDLLRSFVKEINRLKENIFKEADIEFAIQNNIVYFLQIRHITRKFHSTAV